MRLIDADTLEKQFGVSDADLLALDEIRRAPTVDAEVVVRCKDCKCLHRTSFALGLITPQSRVKSVTTLRTMIFAHAVCVEMRVDNETGCS